METNSESPKSKSTPPFVRWLFLAAGAVIVFATGYGLAVSRPTQAHPSLLGTFVYILIHVLAVGCVFAMAAAILGWGRRNIRSVSRLSVVLIAWCSARRALLGLAIFATLLGIFYAEENWRGKRAWEKCKRNLEAQGEVLDWSAYIPAPIPDEQNIMKAPKMTEWFVRPKPGTAFTNELSAKFGYGMGPDYSNSSILVAQVSVVPVNSITGDGGHRVVRPDAPDAKEQLGKIVRDAIGPSVKGSWGNTVVQRQPGSINPIRVWLETDKQLSPGDLSQLFSTNLISPELGHLGVEADAVPNSYRILLVGNSLISAKDYLARTDAAAPEFDLIREALKRPQIGMEGDFQRPFEMPIVNFVFMRNLAQTLASRAQCFLLLGQPEQAVRELSLLAESRRFLTAKPTTLVAAMIDVAICGLYVQTIADGFRLQAWPEAELVTLQQQLLRINLLPAVVDAFRGERAAVCHTFRTRSANEMAETLSLGDSQGSPWGKFSNPVYLLLRFAPRGWVYQNLVTIAKAEQTTSAEIIEPRLQRIHSGKAGQVQGNFEKMFAQSGPFNILAQVAVPNFSRATQTLALTQTRVNQAVIVCGLERYRRAHGGYPETLDTLVPRFVENLPHDLMGDEPLKYRRTADGKFLLYSVGWNATDDGGKTESGKDVSNPSATLDWVWPMPPA
jgi:hypothetical protein